MFSHSQLLASGCEFLEAWPSPEDLCLEALQVETELGTSPRKPGPAPSLSTEGRAINTTLLSAGCGIERGRVKWTEKYPLCIKYRKEG